MAVPPVCVLEACSMLGERPHLLFVAWGFPPCRAGGVYRALATANAFVEAGWDVTVITAEREAFERYTGTDDTLEARIDPRVTVKRIFFTWKALETDVRRYNWLRVHWPVLWRRIHARTDKLPFPESGYGPWRPLLERTVVEVHREHPVDLVLATANPHVAFTGAWHLHKTAGVPYVMDYRDAWLLDVFSGNRLYGTRSRAARWENKLVAAAHEVWFVNEPIRAWHRALYPASAQKMQLVANGYDTDFRGDPPAAHGDRPLVFGYIGTVTPKVPLAEFVDGWRSFRTGPFEAAQAHIHGYLGYYHTPRADMLAVVESAEPQGVSYRGPVGKTEIHDTYTGMDALLLILGTGRYVTSGKVFEYLSTGLPIVSVHDPDNAVSDVLRGYPLWFPAASLSAADIASALTAAGKAAQLADPAVRASCLAFAEQYARERQLTPRIEALAASVAGNVGAHSRPGAPGRGMATDIPGGGAA